MSCPRCGSGALSPSGQCLACGASDPDATACVDQAPLPSRERETPLADSDATGIPGRTHPSAPLASTDPLSIGQNFGPRYHIIRQLGQGGMGAVYQAWDQELEVAVAVKVIRPEAVADPAAAEALERRFKRELLLARQVTHKNVVRIHDIGEIGGVKYITMPYVQGADLATVLGREGRLPLDRTLAIAVQVLEGLAAAHDAGVIHRDLKPANIMLDAEDHACIMDFGIARSTSAATGLSMTVAGSIIGTVEYMAPEQARGEAVDQRADVYAFGLILRDMLIGRRQATGGTTAVADLMARMQSAPAALRTVDASIPEPLDALVTRCLQPNPAERYQTSAALRKDLERISTGGDVRTPAARPWTERVGRPHALAAAAVVLVLGLGGYALMSRSPAPGPSSAASTRGVVSLAVLPFRNATGDPALNSLGTSLSEVLATELGTAPSVRMIPPQRLQEVLGDLRIHPNANFSPAELKRIANFASAGSILWGQYVKFGSEIRIDAQLQDLETGRSVPLKASAGSEALILDAVAQLAAGVQQELARGSDEVLKQMQASAWRPSTRSVEALGMYNDGLQLSRQGDHQGALAQFEAAVQADPNFALAHSAAAQAYSNLGYDVQALQFSRRALSMSESMPPGQERYFIAAAHYAIANEPDQAIATYGQLLEVAPNNAAVHFELAALHEQTGALDKAQEHYTRAAELDPKHVASLTAVGRVHIRRGDPQAALQPLNAALSLAVELDNADGRATALQALGIAYKRLGRPAEALKHYQQSLEINRERGEKRGMARSLSEIAQVEVSLGRPQDALKSYHEALAIQRDIRDQGGTSMTLISLGALLNDTFGRPDEALPHLQEALGILRDSGNRGAEALALNNIGSAYLAKGQYSDAHTYFERALELRERTKVSRDIAETLHNLGETQNRMGRFDQALKRYLGALELRRAAGDRRMEAIESYSIGTVFDYQGRYGAAAQSKTEALETYRALKQRDFWLGEILSGHGASLAMSGRIADAEKSLDEALAIARELQNNPLAAQTLRLNSDRLLYAGDPAGAGRLAEQAAQTAARTSDRSLQLWSQAQVARVAGTVQPTRAVATTLAGISRQADSRGATYLSVRASVESAETLLRIGDYRGARQQIDRALPRAESLGLRELQARGEYVLATTMRVSKDGQARRHYASALRILDEMKREPGAEQVLERADLKTIYAECERWSKAT